MAKKTSALTASDKTFLSAWDAEVDAEEADLRNFTNRARIGERTVALKNRAASVRLSASFLKLAGLTHNDARAFADDAFDRTRKLAETQRKRAVAVLKKRVRTNSAEIKKLLAGVKRG